MTSPNAFRSPTVRKLQQASPVPISSSPFSSSPGLPTVKDILSRKGSFLLSTPGPGLSRHGNTERSPNGGVQHVCQIAEPTLSRCLSTNQFLHDENTLNKAADGAARPPDGYDQAPDINTGNDASAWVISSSPTGSPDQPWKKFKNGSSSIHVSGAASPQPIQTGSLHEEMASVKTVLADEVHPILPRMELDARDDFRLERAMVRRRDWTPPTQTFVCDSTNLDEDGPDSPSTTQKEKISFQDVLKSFSFSEVSLDQDAAPEQNQMPTTDATKPLGQETHKPVHRQHVAISTVTKPKSGAGSVRKKPLTITGLATAAYEVSNESALPHKSVLDYFEANGEAQEAEKATDATLGAISKSQPRKRKPRVSRKKTEPSKPILLSPGAARRDVERQDFMFGTSSQLVREQSPSMLRDLRRAILESEQLLQDDWTSPSNSDPTEPVERTKLWNAAARDEDGELLSIDLLDSVDAAREPRVKLSGNPFAYLKGKDAEAETLNPTVGSEVTSDMFPYIYDIVPNPALKKIRERIQAVAVVEPDNQCIATSNPSGDDSSGIQVIQITKASATRTKKAKKTTKKKEQGAISTATVLAGDAGTSHESEASGKRGRPAEANKAAKKPRGRPRKSAVIAKEKKADVAAQERPVGCPIEIPDSASEGIVTPSDTPRSSPEPVFSPATIDLSHSPEEDMEDSLAMEPTEQQANCFGFVTKAVTSCPRTTDPARPSWYEKILMYDPIIVEDLAAWLNAGALTTAGYQGDEIKPIEVKRWCESKSICCLWKDIPGRALRGVLLRVVLPKRS